MSDDNVEVEIMTSLGIVGESAISAYKRELKRNPELIMIPASDLRLFVVMAESVSAAMKHTLLKGVFTDPTLCGTPGSLWGLLKPAHDALTKLEDSPST